MGLAVFLDLIRRARPPVLVSRIADRFPLFFKELTTGQTGKDAEAEEEAISFCLESTPA